MKITEYSITQNIMIYHSNVSCLKVYPLRHIVPSALYKTYGMLERCSTADGGNMFWQFLDPGRLNLCNGEFVKSLVKPASWNKHNHISWRNGKVHRRFIICL